MSKIVENSKKLKEIFKNGRKWSKMIKQSTFTLIRAPDGPPDKPQDGPPASFRPFGPAGLCPLCLRHSGRVTHFHSFLTILTIFDQILQFLKKKMQFLTLFCLLFWPFSTIFKVTMFDNFWPCLTLFDHVWPF